MKMTICMGSSCFARGNRENLESIERFLEEHGLLMEVELAGSRCENLCAEGPVIEWAGVRHHRVGPERLEDLLREVLAGSCATKEGTVVV